MADSTERNPKQHHEHGHGQKPEHKNLSESSPKLKEEIVGNTLVIRANTGVSGDIIVAGLLVMVGCGNDGLNEFMKKLKLNHLAGRVTLEQRSVGGIGGYGLKVDLPHEHEHRNLADITEFFNQSDLTPASRSLAVEAFRIVAEAEGAVHGQPPDEVHFHEVGALDSILDIGLTAALIERLQPEAIFCSPLPVCDGVIKCQHGLLPSPAPAVLQMLKGVPVFGINSTGETVTPTGLALLKAMKVTFGLWPAITVERQATVYGTRRFAGVPNGTIFVWGNRQENSLSNPVQ